jgi:6-phosphogluconolactonase (cycloisomerase 2 family)
MWRSREALLVSIFFAFVVILFIASPPARAQSVKLSPPSQTFPKQSAGTTSLGRKVILTNTDSVTPLAISGIAASGDFNESDDCVGIVPALGVCTITISFAPTVSGALSGVITINDDADNSPQFIPLTGTGELPVSLAPASLSFGSAAVGATSAAKTVTITNNLSTSMTLAVSASGDFAETGSGADPCGTSLAGTASCTISVTFRPESNGGIKGAVTVTYNGGFSPQEVELSGTGTGGATAPLRFSPASVSVGNTVVGSTNTGTQVVVTNKSSATVVISSVSASGDYAAAGSGANPCPASLAPEGTCTFTVTFSPSVTGTITAAVKISDNAAVTPQILDLSGKAVLPVTLSPTTLTFPANDLGVTSTFQTVTLTNNQSSTLTINNIATSGDFAIFGASGACGSTVAALGSCTIGVTFRPEAGSGAINGALTVSHNANFSPQEVKLKGTARGTLPRFAYVPNEGENTVSIYTANVVTGQLRCNGYVLAGNSPTSVAVTPSGKFAYVVNNGDSTVSGFAINSSNGALTPVTGSPVATGADPVSVAVTPSGKFAYVTNSGADTVSGYAIDSATGALTALTSSPFATDETPNAVMVDLTGQFVYVTNSFSHDVSAYTIDTSTGALTAISGSPFATGGLGPRSIAVDPSDAFLYVASGDNSVGQDLGVVSAYTINSTTGALTAIAGSPFASGGTSPFGVTVDPTGRFLYVANNNSNNVSAFTINSTTGALTAIAGSPVPTDSGPISVTVDPTGQFLEVANNGYDNITEYAINTSTGGLSFINSVSARYAPNSLAFATGTAPVTYTPVFAYVTNAAELSGTSSVSAYTVDANTGALTAISGSPFATGANPLSVAVDPSGQFAYVADSDAFGAGNEGISAYTIDATTGALTAISGSPFAAGTSPFSVTVDPSGRFAYAANEGDSTVSGFTINSATGALTAISGSPYGAASEPESVTVDPSGRFAYVANQNGDSVSAYTINPTTGALTAISGSPFGTGTSSDPIAVTVDPSGQYAYVANQGTQSVSAFTINSTSGALASISGSPFRAGPFPVSVTVDPLGQFVYVADSSGLSAFTIQQGGALTAITGTGSGLSNPQSVTVDPSGQFAYVANNNSNNVSAFTINSTSGALTSVSGSPYAAGVNPYSVTTWGKIH